jgi:hypothetical protein
MQRFFSSVCHFFDESAADPSVARSLREFPHGNGSSLGKRWERDSLIRGSSTPLSPAFPEGVPLASDASRWEAPSSVPVAALGL